MPESVIIENCSPTLAGIKTGNIFTIDRALIPNIKEELCLLNKCFNIKGLRVIPLRITKKDVEDRPDEQQKQVQPLETG